MRRSNVCSRIVCIAILAIVLTSLFVSSHLGFAATPVTVSVNVTNVIGTNNLTLGFQLDGDDIRIWRDSSTLQGLASNASFGMVRFFEQKLGCPCTSWSTATKTGTWDWSKIDPLIKKIFAIGAQPLVVLGFIAYSTRTLSTCPRGMPINTTTGLPAPDQWSAYCAAWVSHFKAIGYPVLYYELVNEAYHYFGWPATQPKLGYFMQLYNAAYTAMKAVNPKVQIGNDACVLKSVMDYFISRGKPLDFLSYHAYGTTNPSASDATIFKNAETLYVNETLRVYGVDAARKVYKAAKGVYLPVMHTESNLDFYFATGTDVRIQEMQGAVYNALTFRTGMLDNFSDVSYFHFASSATNNPQGGLGFGMINLDNNKPYYPYYAFQMVGNNLALGDELVQCSSTSSDIRVVAWKHQTKIGLLIISKVNTATSITLQGISGQMQYFKIDDTISWKTPRMQEGTTSAQNSLQLSGYTVMLLQSSLSSDPSSDLSVSNVSQTPPKGEVLSGEAVSVNASITHLNPLEQVILNCTSTNSSTTWTTSINMTHLEDAVWKGIIPSLPVGTNVTYAIIAQDNAGNSIRSKDQGFTFGNPVVPEFPTITLLPLLFVSTLFAELILRRKRKT